jgi:hypothetical protein
VQQYWCRCRSVETTLQSGRFLNIMWDATRKRGEKATVEKLRLGMKSASAKSLVNGRSQVRAVTCHVNDAEKRQASEQSKRMNLESNCTEFESVSGQSGGAERRHHLVEFQLKPVVYRQVRRHRESTKLKKKKKCGQNFEGSRVAAEGWQGDERRQSVCNDAVEAVK